MKPRILVTPRSVTRHGHPSLERLRAAGYQILFCTAGLQPDEQELRTLLPGCVGYLAGVESITAEVLETASDLRVISRNGTGLDNVDCAAATARGITVLRVEGANARSVAELTIGQLFALARQLPERNVSLKRGVWERGLPGVELEGKVLGVVGCGAIGKLVAGMALGIRMRVIAYDVAPDETFAPGKDFRIGTFQEVLTSADFLSFHCPAPPDGCALLDSAAIAQMKRGSFIINTARSTVLDSAAVLAALDVGQIAGLALDVFDMKQPADLDLARHPRVIATPHIGAFTVESIDRAMDASVGNLLTALREQVDRGDPLRA
jgi:D-3-phosphoglycerate dehydrogenase